MGWNIVRVWSTDWFDNPGLQTQNLVRRLEEFREKSNSTSEGYKIASTLSGASKPGPVQHVEGAASEAELQSEVIAPTQPKQAPVTSVPADPSALLEGESLLSEEELRSALRAFRDTVIAIEMTNWESQRSILRETMIETFVAQRIDDPNDWFKMIPTFQRSGTNPVEKRIYLERICSLIGRLDTGKRQNTAASSLS